MKKYIIGISPRYEISEGNRYMRIQETYTKALNRDDIIEIGIVDSNNILDTLEMCDGFLITGGIDIDPRWYNETNDHELSRSIDYRMDEIDRIIIQYAYEHDKPLLGICRGIQCIAAFLGGSLYQDLEYNKISHPLIDEHSHMVKKQDNYGISTILPDEFKVNSYHHQAVKDVPKDFKVLYKNEETIEMIESTTKPILGVQWHPEKSIDDEHSQVIFNYFFNYLK